MNDGAMSTQATEDIRNKVTIAGDIGSSASDGVDGNIKNLSTIANLAKSKKAKLTKLKKLDLPNAKANFKIDFLILGAKKAFIHLQKAFIKTPILWHFDLECNIWIETNTFEYTISRILSQLTLDQFSSNHMTYKNHFYKSKICQ